MPRRRTLATRRRRRAPSQRELPPTTWTAVAQSSSAASRSPWRRLPASLSVMPTGSGDRKRRGDSDGTARGRVCSVPPDEHAASPERPRRRRDDEPKIIPSPHPLHRQHRQEREPLDPQLAPVGPRTLDRAFDHRCQVVEVAEPGLEAFSVRAPELWVVRPGLYRNGHPSHDAGPLSDFRQSMRSLTGSGLPSRGRCCRPIGRSCDGESRDVAPAASSDAPTRCGSPPARSSARRSTIRTSEPDRVRPAGSLNRGQPRHAATRERSGSRSYAQRPTHGREATRVRIVAGAPEPGSRGARR